MTGVEVYKALFNDYLLAEAPEWARVSELTQMKGG